MKFKITIKILVLMWILEVIFLSVHVYGADISIWERCAYIFSSLFEYKPKYSLPELKPNEIKIWDEFLDPVHGKILAVNTTQNHDNLKPFMIWWLYTKLPQNIRYYIENPLVHNSRDFPYYLDGLSQRYSGNTFLNVLKKDYWEYVYSKGYSHKQLSQDISIVKEWLQNGLSSFEKQRTHFKDIDLILLQKYKWDIDMYYAEQWWKKFGEISLPIEKIGKNKYLITVKDNVFEGYIQNHRNSRYIVFKDIPRDLICIPGSNPLDHKYLAKLFQNSNHIDIPEIFYASIGLDGRFYLDDGNHRFVVSNRKKFKLRMPYPPKTLSLRDYIMYLGGINPTIKDIIAIYKKEKAIDDVVFAFYYNKNNIIKRFKSWVLFELPDWKVYTYKDF